MYRRADLSPRAEPSLWPYPAVVHASPSKENGGGGQTKPNFESLVFGFDFFEDFFLFSLFDVPGDEDVVPESAAAAAAAARALNSMIL